MEIEKENEIKILAKKQNFRKAETDLMEKPHYFFNLIGGEY